MARSRFRIVIAGGGVAGLEALLALRALAGTIPHITLVTSAVQTVDRPATVAEPFDRGVAPTRDVAAIAADHGAELHLDRLAAVDAQRRVVVLGGGDELPYDALIVATGAGALRALDGAVAFRGPDDVDEMRAVRDALLSGEVGSVAFALPGESTWPVPLYELALMTGADLLAAGVDAAVTIVTPEPSPLALFGPSAAEALAPRMAERRVVARTGVRPVAVQPGRLALSDGGTVPADRVVAMPAVVGRPPTGLPSDAAGFVPVDAHGRVAGLDGVYAAGDVTAFPLKQGGLAAQQADAAAEAVAAQMGVAVDPQPFRPVVRGMLLIGGAPLYLRAEIGAGEGMAEAVASTSTASAQALWWPPAKVAARYLGPYLATARPRMLAPQALVDRAAPERPPAEGDREAALGLALALADGDARWGDYAAAVRALDAAETLAGSLPPEYVAKRERWRTAR
ncbi:MAG TPA: FAD-dependent oxidoreductase [Capillimicrobium sp.]|nr:FAD-dependent oxidoreductase [Capillimicrobium sp.]